MKTRVNLYVPDLRPKRQWFVLSDFLFAWCGISLLVFLISFTTLSQYQSRLKQFEILQAENQTFDQQIKDRTQVLEARKPNPELLQQLTELKTDIENKQRFIGHLSRLGPTENAGFSAWFRDFANASQPDISLESFQIRNESILMKGLAAKNDAVPRWMSRFSQYPMLRRQRFSALLVERQSPEVLRFELRNEATQAGSK